jgi:hypothetical protein
MADKTLALRNRIERRATIPALDRVIALSSARRRECDSFFISR